MASAANESETLMGAGSSNAVDAAPTTGKEAEKSKTATGTAGAAAAAKPKKKGATFRVASGVRQQRASGAFRAARAAQAKKKTAAAEAAAAAAKPKKVTRKTSTKEEEEEINRLLIMAGIDKPKQKSRCVRAGLARGHFGFNFTGEASQLDTIVKQSKCDMCDVGNLKATVRQLLDQEDYGGDYGDGSEGAAIECDNKDCGSRWYLTRCCLYSDMDWDCGKFHNHCTDCQNLGICIGDYREAHCERCNRHYFAGNSGFPCECERQHQRSRFRMTGIDALLLLGAFLFADDSDYDSDDSDFSFDESDDGYEGV